MKKHLSMIAESGIVIAAVTFLGYALATAYYMAILSYYDIPFEFLNIDINNVIVFMVMLILLTGIVTLFSYVILRFFPYNQYSFFRQSIDITVVFIVVCFFVILANPFSMRLIKQMLITSIICTFLFWTRDIIALNSEYRSVKGFRNKVRIAKSMNNVRDGLDNIYNRISKLTEEERKTYSEYGVIKMFEEISKEQEEILQQIHPDNQKQKNERKKKYTDVLPSSIFQGMSLIILFVSLLSMSFGYGHESQIQRTKYLSSIKYPNFLFITSKNETAILKEFYDGEFTDRVLYLPIDNLSEMELITVEKMIN